MPDVRFSLPSRSTLVLLAVALAAGLAASPLLAHDFWLVPSSFHPAVCAPLAVRLKVGQHLRGDAVPRDPAQVERFALRGPAGESAIAGPAGADPAGYTRLAGPGLHYVIYHSRRNRLDLPADKFEEALTKEGLERVSALRRSRGESGKASTEVFSRCAKALVRVGEGTLGATENTGFDRPVGLPLEIVPEKNPYELKAGATLPVRVLYLGKPLAGVLVVALGLHQAEGTIAARSAADGRVLLTLPDGGFWLIKAVHMVPAPRETGVDWESLWASLTFELPAM